MSIIAVDTGWINVATSSATARHCWRRKRRAWCGVVTPSVASALSTLRVMRPACLCICACVRSFIR